MNMLKDATTKEERFERSKIKDSKFSKMLKEIAYKNEGECWLKALNNSCLERLINKGNYEVEQVSP